MFEKDIIKTWKLEELVGKTLSINEFLDYENMIKIVYADDHSDGSRYILSYETIYN